MENIMEQNLTIANASFDDKLELSDKSCKEEQASINKGKNPSKVWSKIYKRIGRKINRQDRIEYEKSFVTNMGIEWKDLSRREIAGHLYFDKESSNWVIKSDEWVGFFGKNNDNPLNFKIQDKKFEKVIIKWFKKVKKELRHKGYKTVLTNDGYVLYEYNYLQTPVLFITGLKILNK